MQASASRERIARIAFALVVAVLLWVTVKLSKPYHAELEVPIRYAGLPSNFKMTSPLPDRFTVRVEGIGHQILLPELITLRDTLVLDLGPHLASGRVYTSTWRAEVQNYVSEALRIETISPDTLNLLYADKVNKRVPVVSALSLEPASGFRFTRPIRFYPDSVTLQGTRTELREVKEWPTATILLHELQQNERISVPLAPSNDILFQPNEVQVELPLERFSEKSFEAIVTAQNLPVGKRIRFLPGTLTVHCLVPISRYDDVSARDFTIAVDVASLTEDASLAFPVVVRHPGFVQGIRTQPRAVGFVVTEN